MVRACRAFVHDPEGSVPVDAHHVLRLYAPLIFLDAKGG